MSKTTFFGLKKISEWQLNSLNMEVELPPLQRGFVWKASQVEELWDSILRGFPIGSFLLSENEGGKLLILDGQQRATSITLGFYDPWNGVIGDEHFWSLKNIPIIWIDLAPSQVTQSQKYVIRVLTRSHPWGYQRFNHAQALSVSDRKNALTIFRQHPENKDKKYVDLDSRLIFPYDADIPIPLPFLIETIFTKGAKWKEDLLLKCQTSLPTIKTKYTGEDFFNKLREVLANFDENLYKAVESIKQIQIPGIVVGRDVLAVEDDDSAQDPTLFVRLNASGTRIAGEELIYSIYKAAFPEAKVLMENIGQSFVPPSLVISIIARLVLSSLNGHSYPAPLTVNDFRKRIKESTFRNRLKEFIGTRPDNSPARILFDQAIQLLSSGGKLDIPPALVKNIINRSSDLFMMLLQSLTFCDSTTNAENKKSLAVITALHWFGRDNAKYVQRIWGSLPLGIDFWTSANVSEPFYEEENPLIHPFVPPTILKDVLLQDVVEAKIAWNDLYPKHIIDFYRQVTLPPVEDKSDTAIVMWNNFMNKLFWCRPMILFAQREYINETFGAFNSMDVLEDTNTPWDWDHIYPDAWIRSKWRINANTKHWNNCIGNFRALALEENRSENDSLSPSERLAEKTVRIKSFVSDHDYFEYWCRIQNRINEGDDEQIKVHLKAVISRLCDIYALWYDEFGIPNLFPAKRAVQQETTHNPSA